MSHWLAGLRARRLATATTVTDLAKVINVHPNSYLRYEQGTRTLTVDKAFCLADALGCTLDSLRHDPHTTTDPESAPAFGPAPGNIISETTGLVVPAGWDEDN